MRTFFIIIAFLLSGCCDSTKKEMYVSHSASVPLYPGYLAKADGRILWFPAKPEFDHEEARWVGNSFVEVTSCIADPWPYGPGGASCIIKTDF